MKNKIKFQFEDKLDHQISAINSTVALFDELKQIKPVVILDEPQRIEGTRRKPSKSIQAINDLEPLFILKYSATHKKEFPFNMIYKLDSFDAFQQDLVKRILVKTVYGVIPKSFAFVRYMGMNRNLKAKIEILHQHQGEKIRLKKFNVLGGASLYDLSGGLSQYENMRISENPHTKKALKIAIADEFFELDADTSNKDVTQAEAVRIQIRLAIKNHLDKQFEILDAGRKVKALTLFFIDAVKMVRDDDREDNRGEYFRIFDETYQALILKGKYRKKFEQYKTLFPGYEDIANVREGYFARGLRLPVDIHGKRIKDDKVNELTVIANDHYDHFADTLQRDFNDTMAFNRDEVTAEILTTALEKSGVPAKKITPELVDIFKKELLAHKIINNKNILTKDVAKIQDVEFTSETLKEHALKIKETFVGLMVQRGTHRISIGNGDESPTENRVWRYVTEGVFKKILGDLQHKLMKRALYKFDLDQEAFIRECIGAVNDDLRYKSDTLSYKVTTGTGGFDDAQKFALKTEGNKIMEVSSSGLGDQLRRTPLEIMDDIMYHTMLPRLAIMKIIRGLEKPDMLQNQDILERVTRMISRLLKEEKARNIKAYEVIEGYHLDSTRIFEADVVDEELLKVAGKYYKTSKDRGKAVHSYYRMDSKGEYEFARQLEENENVFLFTKLKKGGFVIDTPYGNYSPDWAIVYRCSGAGAGAGLPPGASQTSPGQDSSHPKNEGEKQMKLYFIAETKADKEWSDLSGVEQGKIACGKLHFKAVSDDIRFDWVSSYSDFKSKFGVVEG